MKSYVLSYPATLGAQFHEYREIHYNIGQHKNEGQQIESSTESNIVSKKIKSGKKNEECTVTVKTATDQ